MRQRLALTGPRILGMRDVDYAGSLRGHALVEAVIHYLHQEVILNPLPWYRPISQARVKGVRFDFLPQTIEIRDEHPPAQYMKNRPRRKTFEEHVGLQNVGATWKFRPPGDPANRAKCDTCYLKESRNALCIQEPNTNSCQQCFLLGRPCTWTPWKILNSNAMTTKRMKTALLGVELNKILPVPIADPRWNTARALEETAGNETIDDAEEEGPSRV